MSVRRLLPAVVQLQRRVRGHLLRRRLMAQTTDSMMLNVSLIGADGPASAPAATFAKRATTTRVVPLEARPPAAAYAPSDAPADAPANVRSRQTAADFLSALAPHARRKDRSWRGRLRRMTKQCNESLEIFCVYCLSYINVLCAGGFVVGYVAMTLSVFRGAPWNGTGHSCS